MACVVGGDRSKRLVDTSIWVLVFGCFVCFFVAMDASVSLDFDEEDPCRPDEDFVEDCF